MWDRRRGTAKGAVQASRKALHGRGPSTLGTDPTDDDRHVCTAIYRTREPIWGEFSQHGEDGVAMKESESEHQADEWFDWFNEQSGDAQIPFGD